MKNIKSLNTIYIVFILAICSTISYIYGDAVRDFIWGNLKFHWLIFAIYTIGAMVLLEIAFESKWINNQSKFIRYTCIIITIIYCSPLMISGFTLIFGSFIEVPISIFITIISRIIYYLAFVIYFLLYLLKLLS